MIIRNLTEAECAEALTENRLGRLACARDGQPYVVPVYYAYADRHLYAFSLPGRKIDFMRVNPLVSVLVESAQQGGWRSVVVDGRYEELPDEIGHKRERDHAWALLSRHADWWEPGSLKPILPVSIHAEEIFFRIAIDRMSGREAKA
ncbi:pyridoxamine 5'-phosphate oxidase family protein [Chelativorans alearense]|uniref:pyridoxamine 5'-phosphate oxidase family protein n=1 Tax=Chelativorans alearense TaxID=2681495 RepID=UPI0013D3A7E9|nr:pyridoxamine 5'-phosphate oxidase family protein [Chelativorans alearense]